MPQTRRQHPVNIDSTIVVVGPKRLRSDELVRRFLVEHSRRAEKWFWTWGAQSAGELAIILRQRRPATAVRGVLALDQQSASFADHQIVDDECLDFNRYEQMLHFLFCLLAFFCPLCGYPFNNLLFGFAHHPSRKLSRARTRQLALQRSNVDHAVERLAATQALDIHDLRGL